MGGMQYLWDNPEDTGTLGLRFLQNVDKNDRMIKETCGAGFFRNLADLEIWSSTHPSHLAIFVGALAHGEWNSLALSAVCEAYTDSRTFSDVARRFGPDKKFMTWVSKRVCRSSPLCPKVPIARNIC